MTTAETACVAPVVVVTIEVARQAAKNNNYLIIDPDSGQAVIVDPAWQLDKIENALAQTGSRLAGILITHSHPDHIDLAARLAALYDCPIWMSRREIQLSGFHSPHLMPVDLDPWSIGAMRIEPLSTPGHTPGSVCFLVGDNVFTGDVLFPEGCGICPGLEAAHDMFASLQLLKARLAPDTRIFPGHTYIFPPGQRFSDVLRRNKYLRFTDKDAFAAFRLRPGQDRRKQMRFR
jgi:hydroxyacylglutathione hydrolase